jgi:uncharacterized membrane protein YdbT with pleckstrin-like domain
VSYNQNEQIFYDSAPSMFRNKPFFFILCVVSIIAGGWGFFQWTLPNDSKLLNLAYITLMFFGGLGFISLASWWLRVINIRLIVTNERVTLRMGILSKNIREVFLSDIRSVQINQRFMQRILNTGHVEISSAASSDAEIRIDGIPNPNKVKDLIDKHRREHQIQSDD